MFMLISRSQQYGPYRSIGMVVIGYRNNGAKIDFPDNLVSVASHKNLFQSRRSFGSHDDVVHTLVVNGPANGIHQIINNG